METTFWQDVNQYLHTRTKRTAADKHRIIMVWLIILVFTIVISAVIGAVWAGFAFQSGWFALIAPAGFFLAWRVTKFLDFYEDKYGTRMW